jgi:putative DNA primase/helicase
MNFKLMNNELFTSSRQPSEVDFAIVKPMSPEEALAHAAAIKKAAFDRNLSVGSEIKEMILIRLCNEPELKEAVLAMNWLIFEHEAGKGSGASVKKDEECFFSIRELLRAAKSVDLPIIKMAKTGDSVYQYTGKYHKKIDRETVRATLPVAAYKSGVKYSQAFNPSFVDDLNRQLLELAYAPSPALSKTEVKINLQNVTICVRDGNVYQKPHDKADHFRYCLDYKYDPVAECPTWLKFLDRILPDKSVQAVLQEFTAWCLIPHDVLSLEAILIMSGDGSNGKSTAQKVIIALLGKENCSEKSLSDLSKNPNSRAEIMDKLANIAGETGTKFASEFFKSLASGDAIEAKRLYQDTFTMKGGAKHIFAMNERPRDVEITHGFFRKWLEVPFNETIEGSEKIKNFETILYKELPGILNWVLEGVKRIMKTGAFTHSEIIEQTNQEFREEADSVLSFIKENGYKPSRANFITSSSLHASYSAYVKSNGGFPLGVKGFSRRLTRLGYKKEKHRIGQGFFIEESSQEINFEPIPF